MLTPRHVATIRAALLYWQDEMCPHGRDAMQAYLEPAHFEPLCSEEIAELRVWLLGNLRFAVYNADRDQLDGTELFAAFPEAELAAGQLAVASVLVPSPALQSD